MCKSDGVKKVAFGQEIRGYYGLTIEDWGLRNGDIGLRIADWSLNIVNGGVRIEDQCLMIGDRLFMFKFWG